MKDIKQLIVIADRIQDALRKLKHGRYKELLSQVTYLEDNLTEIIDRAKRLRTSLERGWLSAARSCCDGINRITNDVSYYLSRFKELNDKPAHEVPQLSALVEDIRQLQQECGKVELDKAANTISVVTEPITLEDVYLGPFEIKLDLNRLPQLYRSSPYHCIALDPHPAAASDDVTHPHVNGDRLCEGEGCPAIRTALEQGRLCDFFTIIRGILNTYSPESPYVQLSEWEGVQCYDCGYITDGENSYYCGFCDNSFCEECSTCCRTCNETVCLGCATRCEVCDEPACPNCVETCPRCGTNYCQSCLEDDACPKCKEDEDQESEVEENEQRANQQITATNKNSEPDNSNANPTEIRIVG